MVYLGVYDLKSSLRSFARRRARRRSIAHVTVPMVSRKIAVRMTEHHGMSIHGTGRYVVTLFEELTEAGWVAVAGQVRDPGQQVRREDAWCRDHGMLSGDLKGSAESSRATARTNSKQKHTTPTTAAMSPT